MNAAILIAAILHLYPGPQSQCIARRAEAIAVDADAAAEQYGVPVSILLATAFLETHIGCDHGEGGGLGAPIDRDHRHTAGGWDQHGSALRLGFARCHDWTAAVNHYRTGTCGRPAPIGYQAGYAMQIAGRIEHPPTRSRNRPSPVLASRHE